MNLPRAGQSQPKGRIRPAGRKMPRSALSHDMVTISSYLQKWKLKLCTTKTLSDAFHLNNQEAQPGLSITVEE